MYIAIKDLTLSGVRYLAGESIPKEAVVPNRAAALMRSAYIAKREDGGHETAYGSAAVGVPVHLQKSGTDIVLRPEEASAIFVILQETAEDAACSLAQSSREVLLVVKELDSRKGVRAAAESFLQEIEENP